MSTAEAGGAALVPELYRAAQRHGTHDCRLTTDDIPAMWVTVLLMAVIAGLAPAGIAAIRVMLSRS